VEVMAVAARAAKTMHLPTLVQSIIPVRNGRNNNLFFASDGDEPTSFIDLDVQTLSSRAQES
jgi:hypothetical protein